MLSARSAHAVVSSDSSIYSLTGTNERGKPVLDVESFDGEQWKVETTMPGQGLNAAATSIVGDKLYGFGSGGTMRRVRRWTRKILPKSRLLWEVDQLAARRDTCARSTSSIKVQIVRCGAPVEESGQVSAVAIERILEMVF